MSKVIKRRTQDRSSKPHGQDMDDVPSAKEALIVISVLGMLSKSMLEPFKRKRRIYKNPVLQIIQETEVAEFSLESLHSSIKKNIEKYSVILTGDDLAESKEALKNIKAIESAMDSWRSKMSGEFDKLTLEPVKESEEVGTHNHTSGRSRSASVSRGHSPDHEEDEVEIEVEIEEKEKAKLPRKEGKEKKEGKEGKEKKEGKPKHQSGATKIPPSQGTTDWGIQAATELPQKGGTEVRRPPAIRNT